MRRISAICLCCCCICPLIINSSRAQVRLPEVEAAIAPFEYVEDGTSWPPELKGVQNIKVLPPDEVIASVVTESFLRRADEVAQQSPEFRRVLGERFAVIGATLPELSKEPMRGALEQQFVEVTYYSYSRNVAVVTVIRNGELVSSRDVEGFQPPETKEEVARAAKIAKADPRLAGVTDALEATGLITEYTEGQKSEGNRLIYVSFGKAGTAITDYFAVVDLTTETVVDAGRAAGNN
jgi:hypothetical protein